MTKYEPLKQFLADRSEGEIPMTFHEIEELIKAPLPPSAFKHRAWWSNNPSNSVITYAWLAAGYETERVDMGSHKLIFRRAHPDAGSTPPGATGSSTPSGVLARLRAKLGGTVQFAPGFDPNEPTGEIWDAERN